MNVEVDVCVVGSGPAGALVASQLAGRGKRIAIVEAGRWNDSDAQARMLANGDAAQLAIDQPHLHVPLRVTSTTAWLYWQLKRVGGNSLVWNGWCPRALENQFKPRSLYGVGEDWPIAYDDLEPYYCDAEVELGVSGDSHATHPWRSKPYPLPPVHRDHASLQFADACTRLGLTWEQAPVARALQPYGERSACCVCNVVGCSLCLTGARYTSEVHVRRALADPQVTLLTETTAAKLVTGTDGKVTELVCFMPDRSRRVIKAGFFVLAASPLGTARLLLLSDVANRSDAVGRYFMTHPVRDFAIRTKRKVNAARSQATIVCRQFEDGPHLRDCAGFRMFVNSADRSAPLHGIELAERGLYGAELVRELEQAVAFSVKASVITDVLPRADNRVELDHDTRDAFGQPGLELTYEYDDYTRAGHALGASTLARVIDAIDGALIGSTSRDVAHQMGTTRMGTDAATSVVDRNLRAHDVDNLYIVGGAVFPNALGPTNPTLTIAALALRLAHHLQSRLT